MLSRTRTIMAIPQSFLIYPVIRVSSVIRPRHRQKIAKIVNSFMSSIWLSLGYSKGLECKMQIQRRTESIIWTKILIKLMLVKMVSILKAYISRLIRKATLNEYSAILLVPKFLYRPPNIPSNFSSLSFSWLCTKKKKITIGKQQKTNNRISDVEELSKSFPFY